MYIVRRGAQVAGIAGLDWAMKITKVVQDAGVPVSLWLGGPGTTPGSVVWSATVDSFADWAAHTERLLGHEAYRQASAEGAGLVVAFATDRMMQVVHGSIDAPTEVGGYLGAIEATVHPDRSLEAAAFAAEIADAWSATTGVPAVVATDAAGDMGTVTWLARHAGAAGVDEANGKIAASAEYQEVLARGAGLFTEGVQMYARRVA